MSYQARFWAKVQKAGGDRCWIWTAAKNKLGYGLFGIGRRSLLAHRVAYELTHGSIADGMLIRHRCDNPSCVRPDHLLQGTDADNMRDSIERGRRASSKGTQNGRAKLTVEQVREIRRRYLAGSTTILVLAGQFGVGKSQIYNIVSNAQWNEMPA